MKIRIVVDFKDNCSLEIVEDQVEDVQQLFMRRDQEEEPWVHVEVSIDEGKTWKDVEMFK